MRYPFVKIVLLVFLLPAVTHAQSYSLQDILVIAETKSIFHHQAVADNARSQAEWGLHQANLKPSVQMNLLAPNYSKTSREIIQPDGSIRFQSVRQNNSTVGLTLEQPLLATGATLFAQTDLQRFDDFSASSSFYNGIPFRIGIFQPLGGLNQLKWDNRIKPLELRIANKQYVIDMERIHLLAVERYFDLLIAQVNLQTAASNSEVNERLVAIAEERYDLGKISRSELLQLQLELKGAIRSRSVAQYQVTLSEGALWTFLAQPPADSIMLSFPEPFNQIIYIDPDLAIEQAFDNRPEIIDFERQLLESNRAIRAAKVDYGIQANLFASYGYARGSDQLSDIYGNPISEEQLQLRVNIPILDWGRRKNATAIAMAEKELAEQQIAQGRLDFRNEIAQKVNSFMQLQQEVRLQKDISETAAERFDIARQRYILGDISITDLTIAQREKDQALVAYIASLRSYWTDYYQLRVLTGYDFINNDVIRYQTY